ncbi:TPA: hypothetical protein ACH3X3_010489 [Trebouxia sp. C0006]
MDSADIEEYKQNISAKLLSVLPIARNLRRLQAGGLQYIQELDLGDMTDDENLRALAMLGHCPSVVKLTQLSSQLTSSSVLMHFPKLKELYLKEFGTEHIEDADYQQLHQLSWICLNVQYAEEVTDRIKIPDLCEVHLCFHAELPFVTLPSVYWQQRVTKLVVSSVYYENISTTINLQFLRQFTMLRDISVDILKGLENQEICRIALTGLEVLQEQRCSLINSVKFWVEDNNCMVLSPVPHGWVCLHTRNRMTMRRISSSALSKLCHDFETYPI